MIEDIAYIPEHTLVQRVKCEHLYNVCAKENLFWPQTQTKYTWSEFLAVVSQVIFIKEL